MADEFENRRAPEVNPQVENKIVRENYVVQENKTVSENVSVKENLDTVGKAPRKVIKKGRVNIALLSAGLVGAVSLALVGITTLVNVKMKAKFENVKYNDGKIEYRINVSNMTEKETLSVYSSRDTGASVPTQVFDEDGDGIIEGAIEIDKSYIAERFENEENVDIKYTVDLKGMVGLDIIRSFDSYEVHINKKVAKFYYVEGHCHCGVDGYYYFTMNYEDYQGIFSDFKAWIEDDFGNKAYCTFSDNLYEEQKIYVLENLEGSHGKLVIKYKADDGKTEGKDENGYYTIETEINM